MAKIETEPFDIGDKINDLRKELEGKIETKFGTLDTKIDKRVPLWALYIIIPVFIATIGGIIAYIVSINEKLTIADTHITVIETKLGIHSKD